MNFDLKKPCTNCPFHKESHLRETLEEGRMEKIVHDIVNGGTFECHKTAHDKKKKAQHCAGAILMVENHSRNANQPLRIAERFGMYKRSDMDFSVPVINATEYLERYDKCDMGGLYDDEAGDDEW